MNLKKSNFAHISKLKSSLFTSVKYMQILESCRFEGVYNKDMFVENLKEDSLIGLRTVYDAVIFYGGVVNVPLTERYASICKIIAHEIS